MNAKFLFAVVALVALVANAYAQSECATAVLGSRDIDSVVIFSDLRALPELVLNDVVQGSILKGQAWTVVRFDSFSEPTVSLEIDCGVDFESCSPSGTESQTTRTANHVIDDNTFSQDDGSFGFVFGDRRTTTLDLNCESAFNSSVSLSASAKIGVPENLVVVSGNGDDSNTCDMTTSVEWTFGNFDLRPYAGRGFVLTFVDFEREKDDPLDGQITITQANGNTATATRELRVGANEQTTFIFEWNDFTANGGNLNGILANAVSVEIAIFGIADDDFVVDFLATYAHFVTGRVNAGCPGSTNTCSDAACTAMVNGVEYHLDSDSGDDFSDKFDLISDFYPESKAPQDVGPLPYTSFDWAAYVSCGSTGYFWFALNPGTYTVMMTCEDADPTPADGYDFCTAFLSDDFAADRAVHAECGGNNFVDYTWGDIQCISNRTVPICDDGDQVYPSIGLQSSRHINNDLIPCINFEFSVQNTGFEFICPEDVAKDCSKTFGRPTFEARDPVCDVPIPVDEELTDDTSNCCIKKRVVRGTNEEYFGNQKTCVWTSTLTDTTAPEWDLTDFQEEHELACGFCDPLDDKENNCGLSFPDAADDCCEFEITYTTVLNEDLSSRCEQVYIRTFFLEDECENSAEPIEQIIRLKDMEPPTFTCPKSKAASCGPDPASLSAEFFGDLDDLLDSIEDDCQDDIVPTQSDAVTDSDCDDCEQIITRTWVVDDQCHPAQSCEQIITLNDHNAPELTIPEDAWVGCGGSTDPDYTGWALTCDNCDPNVEVRYVDNPQEPECNEDVCALEQVIRRRWTSCDRCGNCASLVQLITVAACPPCTEVLNNCHDECVLTRNKACKVCAVTGSNSAFCKKCDRVDEVCWDSCKDDVYPSQPKNMH